MARLIVAAVASLAIMAASAVAWSQSAGEPEGVADKPAAAAPSVGAEPGTAPSIDPKATPGPVVPPPSTYDLKSAGEDVSEKPQPEEINWGTQLVKTIIALFIVVGLIYFLFKVGLARLLGYATTARGGKSLKIVDRMQLDARHALFMVELSPGHRLLLGTGERGVQVLSHVGADGKPIDSTESFKTVLGKTTAGASVTMSAPEGDGDAHEAS